jgi:uridine kinase
MKNLIKLLEANILKNRNKHTGCVTIGINGLDCSGKTYFSERLHESISASNMKSSIVHIDDFCVPEILDRVYDRVDKGEFTSRDIDSYYEECTDMKRLIDAIASAQENSDFLIIEGIFIYKPPLRELIDFKVYLDVDKDVAIERFLSRHEIIGDEVPKATAIFNNVWYASHLKYCSEASPLEAADIVIDNDFSKPKIVRYNEEHFWLSEYATLTSKIEPFSLS